MTNSKTADDVEYTELATTLIEQYGPSVRATVDTPHLPDALVNEEEKHIAGDLVIYDDFQGANEPVADIEWIGTGEIIITMPADWVPPMHRQPFEDIEDPETLSAAGQHIYEIIELVNVIIVSTYCEVTNKRKLIKWVERLLQEYDYSAADIRSGLIQVAQKRGDLPTFD